MCFLKCERDPLYLHVRTHSFPTRGSSDLFDLGSWAYECMLGIPVEAIAILAIVLLNAGLGSFQEYRSEQALAQLKAMAAPQAWEIGRAHSELQSLMRNSYAVFCLTNKT